jgi:hypothetical protein
MRKPSVVRVALVLLAFAGMQAASCWPQFHRHANEIGRGAALATVQVGTVSPAEGEPGCQACALIAASAMPATGAEAPRPASPGTSLASARPLVFPSAISSFFRGRAPPLG